jgi:hypothetical protein
MENIRLTQPELVPESFFEVNIDASVKIKMAGVELPMAEFVETFEGLFLMPSLEDVCKLASAGAFGCVGPVTVRRSRPDASRRRIAITGKVLTPALVVAALNMIDSLNKGSRAKGPYEALALTFAAAPDTEHIQRDLANGAFLPTDHADVEILGLPADFEPRDRQSFWLSVVNPEPCSTGTDPDEFCAIYEFLAENRVWIARTDLPSWRRAGRSDCEAWVKSTTPTLELKLTGHRGPLEGLKDLLRAVAGAPCRATYRADADR